MSALKKVRKLIRDPNRFLADSRNPLLQSVGSLVYGSTAPAKPVAAPKAAPTKLATAPKATPAKAPTPKMAQSLTGYSTAAKIFERPSIFSPQTQWDWHKNHTDFTHNDPKKIAIFPSGSTLWDAYVLKTILASGHKPAFVPLWKYLIPGQGTDDLNFHCRQNPAAAHRLAVAILTELRKAGVRSLVLPHDATASTRALSLSARTFEISTLCLLKPGTEVLQNYQASSGPNIPAVDVIAYFTGISGNLPAFVGCFADERFCLEIDASILREVMADSDLVLDKEFPLEAFGITEGSDLILLVGLEASFGIDDRVVASALKDALEIIEKKTTERTHLVAILNSRKFGYLNAEARGLLAQMRRKTVLLHGDKIPYAALVHRATHSFVLGTFEAMALQGNNYLTVATAPSHSQPIDTADPQSAIWRCVTMEETLTSLNKADNPQRSLILLDKLGRGQQVLDTIAVPDPLNNLPITKGRQRHLNTLLGARRRVYGAGNPLEALQADIFVQWGAEPNEAKSRPETLRTAFGRPTLFLEDGFVRSVGLWTDVNEPALSVIMDTHAAYYDSTRSSLLERILNSDMKLSESEIDRARYLIHKIVHNKISKYNYAPDLKLDLQANGRKKILLIDQKFGDMSIKYGLASSESFKAMFTEALSLGDEAEIIIKQHPCAITNGADQAHFTAEKLGEDAYRDNVHLIAFDINPYSLIEAVDEVWTVCSGMGFETLMARKPVRCFGAPFYSGWGVTDDRVPLLRRTTRRTVEEIFHTFYLRLSRYVDPRSEEVCDLDQLLDYIIEVRSARDRAEDKK